MIIDLKKKDLVKLIEGSYPDYYQLNHPLVVKAGHIYDGRYRRSYWLSLDKLSEEELLKLYKILNF